MAKPQATSLDHREAELFRGRAEELALARCLWETPLSPDQRRVLLVTGIGGIGKSALARRIVGDLRDRHASDPWLEVAKPAYGAIDLAEAWSQDVVQALLQLRLQLGLTWREARFPLFDFAFARIHSERFPSSDVLRQYQLLNPDGTVVHRLTASLPMGLDDSERLQDVADGINEILADTPLLGTAYKYLNRVFARGLHELDQRTEPLLREIAATGADLLDQRLPECLGMDLRNAIRTAEQRRPVTVVIDTIEALHRASPTQSGIEAFQNDALLRELVWQAPGVGFVQLGRDDVEWPILEHVARAPKAVLARFASHLGERLAPAFAILAHARRFDAALLHHLKEQPGTLIGAVGLPEITRYSLVEGDADGYFRLHQHYQDIQREELARSRPDNQRRIDGALFVWWDAACQPPDLRSLTPAHETALREAAHHQQLLDPAGHVGWLASRWRPFQQAARLRLVEELWRTAMGLCERVNGAESAAMVAALGNLGIVLQMQGRLDAAREAEERMLRIFEQALPANHPYIAQACGNLANTLEALGESEQAAELQARVEAIRAADG